MVVVTGVALLLGLCAVSIQLLMKLNADVQGRYAEAVALERLGRQLRDDAHASQTAEIVEMKRRKRPGQAGRSAAGHCSPSMSSSTSSAMAAWSGPRSRAGKTVRHERFTLARGARRAIRASRRGHRAAGGVGHRLDPPGKSQAEPPRPLELVALQGKDRVTSPGNKGASHNDRCSSRQAVTRV